MCLWDIATDLLPSHLFLYHWNHLLPTHASKTKSDHSITTRKKGGRMQNCIISMIPIIKLCVYE